MYLDVADSVNLPYGWNRYAQFSLAVVNQIHPKYTIRKGIITFFHLMLYFPCRKNATSQCIMDRGGTCGVIPIIFKEWDPQVRCNFH